MNGKPVNKGIVAIIALAAVAAGFLGYTQYKSYLLSHKRQAVFLTNGQVYFGYLYNSNSQFVELKDVYYLKTQDTLSSEDPDNKKKISLVKMGNELHGPENRVYINRDQILFFETMKDKSKVVEAINKFLEKQAASQTQGNSQ